MCREHSKLDDYTPTFISIVPNNTSILELPVLAMVMIWIIRRMLQTVVKSPRMKSVINAIFRLMLICNFIKIGIGRRKITQS
jgi:hypothetical protein